MTSQTELTRKQKEVLALLQSGKTNKDIASALGIQAGTVKQHLVTIFRKLGVKNRTHAALQPTDTLIDTLDIRDLALASDVSTHLVSDTHLERRPCVTLILTMSEDTDEATLQQLQHRLEQYIQPYRAVVIGRRKRQREIIFGLEKTATMQAAYALDTALRIAQAWQVLFPKQQNTLRAYLCHTLIIASMDESDQWTEEVLMSVELGHARQQIQQVAQGKLSMSPDIRQQLLTQGIRLTPEQNTADFDAWRLVLAVPQPSELIGQGHSNAMAQLNISLENRYEHNPIALLIGHEGLGKSHILWHLYQAFNQQTANSAYYFRFLPETVADWLTDNSPAGSTETLLARLKQQSSIKRLLLDDVHLLSEQARNGLLYFIEKAGYQAIFSSTQPLYFKTLRQIKHISLHPLSTPEMTQLSAHINQQRQGQISIAEQETAITLAQGNPALLQALLTHPKMQGSLFVTLSMMSRIDGLGIQRSRLRELLLSKTQPSTQPASRSLKQTLVLALLAGILEEKIPHQLTFRSPLMARILKAILLVLPEMEQMYSV